MVESGRERLLNFFEGFALAPILPNSRAEGKAVDLYRGHR